MRIFLTGGTGFIGKYVTDILDDGNNQLLVLTRNPQKIKSTKTLKVLRGDLLEISNLGLSLKKFKPDVAIHLAWEGIPDYGVKNSLNNLNQGLNLFLTLSETGCRKIIAAGSLWEYGNQTGKVSEKTLPIPFNTFTASKNSLNYLGREIAKEKNIDFIWTRIFYVYGPGQKNTSLIPYLINSIKNQTVPEVRNPNAQNDFIYVKDVAQALVSLVKNPVKNGEYNIGSGKLTPVKKIIKLINKHFNSKAIFEKGEQKQMDKISSIFANISKIKTNSGWKPETSIEEGIRETIRAFNDPN